MSKQKYMQVYNHLKALIINGEYNQYNNLLSLQKMADIYNVSKSTILSAYDKLIEDNLVMKNGNKYLVTINEHTSSSITTNWANIFKKSQYFIEKHTPHQESMRVGLTHEISMVDSSFGFTDVYKAAISNVVNNKMDTYDIYAEVRKYLQSLNIDTSNKKILLTPTERASLYLLLSTINDNMTIFTSEPNRIQINKSLLIKRVNVVYIETDEQGIIPEDLYLKAKAYDNAMLYIEPNSLYPLGVAMPKERLDRIVNICAKQSIPIVEVDYRPEQHFTNKHHAPLISSIDSENIIYITAFANDFNPCDYMCCVVVPDKIKDQFINTYNQINNSVSTLTRSITADMLKTGALYKFADEFKVKLIERFNEVDNLLKKYLNDYATWRIPDTGNIIFIKFNDDIIVNKFTFPNSPCMYMNGSALSGSCINKVLLWVASATLDEVEKFITSLQTEAEKQVKLYI